jgi:hypothetical protein
MRIDIKLLALEEVVVLAVGLLVWFSLRGLGGAATRQQRSDEDARRSEFAALSKEEQASA